MLFVFLNNLYCCVALWRSGFIERQCLTHSSVWAIVSADLSPWICLCGYFVHIKTVLEIRYFVAQRGDVV